MGKGGLTVLGVKHLLGELGNGDGSVLLRSSSGEGSESDHEEVESGERNHVDRELPQVRVELSGELESGKGKGDVSADRSSDSPLVNCVY